MIAKTNGAVSIAQTIAFAAITFQTRKNMAGAVKNTQRIALMNTAPQMIEQLKSIETRTKKTTRAKKITASPATFSTQLESTTATRKGKANKARTMPDFLSDEVYCSL